MVSPIALILPLLFWIVLASVCGYALWRGGRFEKIAAMAMLAAAGASVLVKPETMRAYHHVEGGTLLIDMLLLGVLVALALSTPRTWPAWAAGFHLAAVITHAVMTISPSVLPAAYALVQGFWAYPVLGALLVGTINVRAAQLPDEPLREPAGRPG